MGKKKRFILYLIIFIAACGIVVALPYLITSRLWFNIVFDNDTGYIGDTIGGTMGPFIAIVVGFLTFLAFWEQYKANEQQRRDIEVERFESKFYTMIELHRQNVAEMNIANGIQGRRLFLHMFRELRLAYLMTDKFFYAEYVNSPGYKYVPRKARYNIAYLIFFFGIGQNSTKVILDLIGDKYSDFVAKLREELLLIQKFYMEEKERCKHSKDEMEPYIFESEGEKQEFSLEYMPFYGHTSRFSHYIRHLFQTVKYVDEYIGEVVTQDMRQAYMTTLRAQLSTYEQLLVYYNSLSVLGDPWLQISEGKDECLLVKYALLRSIPLPLADFYIYPKRVFKKDNNKAGKSLFEWTEIHDRLQKM